MKFPDALQFEAHLTVQTKFKLVYEAHVDVKLKLKL